MDGFWLKVFIVVLALGLAYFLINKFAFKNTSDKSKKQNKLINILLAIGIAYLFYSIYAVIPEAVYSSNPDAYVPGQFFVNNILGKLQYVCVLTLATTGIVLIFKTSTTTNFAQGMIATVGAFIAAKFVIYLTTTFTNMKNTPVVLLAMLAGAVVSFFLGVFIDAVIIRNSKMPTAIGKQMITMGLVLIITGLIPLVFGTIPLSVPRMIIDESILFEFLGMNLSITPNALLSIAITIVLLTVLFVALRFTKWGLGVRATASNEIVASMMGVNTKVITAMSWAIAGLLGAVAAVIWAPNSATLTVVLMIPTQVSGFMAAILGGFSSFAGPIITSIFIPILTGLLNVVVSGWEDAVVYAIILIIVLVKPFGLFGKKVAKKV